MMRILYSFYRWENYDLEHALMKLWSLDANPVFPAPSQDCSLKHCTVMVPSIMSLLGINTASFKGDGLRSSLKKTQERTKCLLLQSLRDTGVNDNSPQGLCSPGELAVSFCLAGGVYWCDLRSSWKASHTGLWTWHLGHPRPCRRCWHGWWSHPGWPRSVRWGPPGALQGWYREPRQLEERVRMMPENADIHLSIHPSIHSSSQYLLSTSYMPGSSSALQGQG